MDTSSTDPRPHDSPPGLEPGSIAVVSGAATGIGLSTATRLAERGVVTYGLVRDRRDAEAAPDLVHWIAADVSRREQVDAAMARIEQEHGRIHLLVSNAAIARHCDISVQPLEDLTAMFATNVFGFFHLVASALPLLRKAGRGDAAIVAVASVHAMMTARMVSGYAATKGALVAAVRAVALDLGPEGIRANVVLPGSVDTPMLRSSAMRRSPDDPDAAIAAWGEQHPIGRVLQAREVADAIIFLGGPAASGITGTSLAVDGGLMARLAL